MPVVSQTKKSGKLRHKFVIVHGVSQQESAYRLVSELGLDATTICRVSQRLWMALSHTEEMEDTKLSGEIEIYVPPTLGMLVRGNERGAASSFGAR